MPDKDFERLVQQKMDELNFVPSDAVWQRVEKEISTDKKRRVLWLPLTFLLLMGVGAWMFYSNTGGHDAKDNNYAAGKKNVLPATENSRRQAASPNGPQDKPAVKQGDSGLSSAEKDISTSLKSPQTAPARNKTASAISAEHHRDITTAAVKSMGGDRHGYGGTPSSEYCSNNREKPRGRPCAIN
ncbi:MAG: hypothetical protein ABI813_05360 [Bacteroidota bacterium]